MSRWKASGIHLLLSGAIVGSVVAFMLSVWYQWPLFEVAGGGGLILILAGVDVTLGPLITLIIFKSGKPGLKFDLTVIALLQSAALAYGVHAVYLARPVYLVYAFDKFTLVTAKDLDPKDLAKVALPEYKSLPLGRPQYAAAVMPHDSREQVDVMLSGLGGKDLPFYPQYYVPYPQLAKSALAGAKPVGDLLKRDFEPVQRYLDSAGRSADSVKFLPLKGRQNATVLLDAGTGAPLGVVLVSPQ